MATNIPGRGDLIVIDFNPQAGHEQTGRRTGIVLSPAAFNEATGFALICPTTNQKKGYPFEVELSAAGVTVANGSPVTGVILVDQLKSMDWRARRIRVLGRAPDEIIDDCLAKIATFLT
ncbi:type II toxin-antitoxin system PemK/MazF family toxin [Radiobacillus sp. PE A8.2]|uniref:type II toxin-antitoxin system PemK/MazF family toxin n=1 Tax=Radiobacillus sp. PE A8.2 TaxID=3380349 RepID=UPI003890F711